MTRDDNSLSASEIQVVVARLRRRGEYANLLSETIAIGEADDDSTVVAQLLASVELSDGDVDQLRDRARAQDPLAEEDVICEEVRRAIRGRGDQLNRC